MPKDPTTPAEPTLAALIAEGVKLKATIKAQEARLKAIAAKLTTALPAGAYEGDDGEKISIIEPAGKIKLTAESLAQVKAIAGTRFAKLFKAVRAWAPVKGFREVVAAVLEKREQKQVLDLVETAALDLLSRGIALITEQFGSVAFSIAGLGDVPEGIWDDLGQTETLELNGRRVSFSVVAEFRRAIFPTATTTDLLKLAGSIVTHNGKQYRIVGEVAVDELTVRLALDSRHK